MVKAAICHEFGAPLKIEEILLNDPKANEVQVDIKACAICHSDIFYMDGAWGGELPAIYGHEAAGIISQLGDGVSDYKIGDHVMVTLIRSCGHCANCASGMRVQCEHIFPLDKETPITLKSNGKPVLQGLRTGAFSEKVVVDQSQIMKISDDMPFSEASLLSCGVITGLGAVTNTAKIDFGANIAVIGCGGVGLNSLQGAHLAGALSVIAIDIVPEKLKIARDFGATHCFDGRDEGLIEEIQNLTQNRGLDFVFVTVGHKSAFELATSLIGRKGQVILVGMPPSGVVADYDPSTMAAYGQSLIGSKMGDTNLQVDIPRLIKFHAQGRLKLKPLISHQYPLDKINIALDEVRNNQVIRNVILF